MAGDKGQIKPQTRGTRVTRVTDESSSQHMQRLGLAPTTQRKTAFPHGGKSERGKKGK